MFAWHSMTMNVILRQVGARELPDSHRLNVLTIILQMVIQPSGYHPHPTRILFIIQDVIDSKAILNPPYHKTSVVKNPSLRFRREKQGI